MPTATATATATAINDNVNVNDNVNDNVDGVLAIIILLRQPKPRLSFLA